MGDLREQKRQRRQVAMLLVSLALVIGAMLWAWQIGMAANGLDHRLDHAAEDLKEMRQTVQHLEGKHA